jgi:predicted nucleotidyltransferase component of viral defense system
MNRKELERYIGITGYSLGQVEKDYIQHVALSAISRKASGMLVFKGGTALQKLGIVPRFSEDLDFTSLGDLNVERVKDAITSTVQAYNFPVEVAEQHEDKGVASFKVKVRGPLYIDARSLCTVRVEISKREKVVLQPESRELSPPYTDVLPYIVEVMQGREIMAEKVRTIYTRQKARDLYDVYRMLEKGIELDKELANGKLKNYGLEFNRSTFLKRCEALSSGWDKELRSLVEDVVPHSEVMNSLKKSSL